MARASALQAEGRRFDSDYLHKIKTSFGRLFFVEISFDPQSLRDSPQGHAAVVFAAIGHLRPPFSMKTPFLRCAAAAAFAVLRASFFVEISFDPQSLCDSPRGHAAVVFSAIGHLRPPFSSRANIIEHADWPYSGVEWHFSCSMRSKWRHRASLSALQPPGTPLALLDELHEERFARRTIRTRDDAEEGSREKRRERQNAEKNTKGKTRRSLLELESVKIRLDRLTLLIRICNSSGKRLIFRTSWTKTKIRPGKG